MSRSAWSFIALPIDEGREASSVEIDAGKCGIGNG